MRADKDRIYREVLAAIISSKLRSSDLMRLADLLSRDRRFTDSLAQAVADVTHRLEPQQEALWDSAIEPEIESSDGGSGLAALAYEVVQRRRMSKDRLVSTFRDIAPEIRWATISNEVSARELVVRFFDRASTSQSQRFLSFLGMDVSQDPYLGGISNRPRK